MVIFGTGFWARGGTGLGTPRARTAYCTRASGEPVNALSRRAPKALAALTRAVTCEYADAVAFLARVQRRQHRDGFTEWIQVAWLVLTVVIAFYVVIIR